MLALIIVGGMGSLPGVVVGATALIGLPELLREFGEYRYLFYGAALVIMMRIRPEGLWPSPTRRRELHADDAVPEAEADACRRGGGLSAMAGVPILITDKLTKHFGGLRAVVGCGPGGDGAIRFTASSVRTAPARPRCST